MESETASGQQPKSSEPEESVTMLDVLEQEKEMEDEYAAVLGASDEKCCTYAQGKVTRQALYSCLTCCPETRTNLANAAGICLACSYRCHEHHELIELYTKRDFRCDCPTERLGANRCVLNGGAEKPQQPRNVDNLYNQNFQGLYCSCHRPYPDPERTAEEVMLQCGVCEDWFHLQHLQAPPAAGKLVDFCSEMICGDCMTRHDFLRDYEGLALKAIDERDDSSADITVGHGETSLCEGTSGVDNDDNKLHSDLDKSISEIMNIGEGEGNAGSAGGSEGAAGGSEGAAGGSKGAAGESVGADEGKDKKEVEEPMKKLENVVSSAKVTPKEEEEGKEPSIKRKKLVDGQVEKSAESAVSEAEKCCRPTCKIEHEKGATFWGNDWRATLCRCSACMELYKTQNVEFLLDADDSAKSYEERGKKRAANETSTYEQGIRALASIGRVQQIDAITEYNRMKDKLKEYLQTFAASKKVVTEEDINRFFAEMRNEKNANLGQPYLCR